MSKREKTQADFDIEKMFAYLDEALTSRDERVQSALRGLLTIIELTRTQDDGQMAVETSHGPLRQMHEDLQNIIRRVNNLEGQIRQQPYVPPQPYNPGSGVGSPFGPYTNPGAGNPWGIDPNMPYTTNKASSSSSYIPPGPYGSLTDNEKDSTINIKLTK